MIYSMDELFDIISCDVIVAERRRPFAKFLVSVYLTSKSGKYSPSVPVIRDSINRYNNTGYLAKAIVMIKIVVH